MSKNMRWGLLILYEVKISTLFLSFNDVWILNVSIVISISYSLALFSRTRWLKFQRSDSVAGNVGIVKALVRHDKNCLCFIISVNSRGSPVATIWILPFFKLKNLRGIWGISGNAQHFSNTTRTCRQMAKAQIWATSVCMSFSCISRGRGRGGTEYTKMTNWQHQPRYRQLHHFCFMTKFSPFVEMGLRL